MSEHTTVGQRFVQLIAHLGISKNAFANSLDKTATVIQHLVEERNKPGFDLLSKVFEVYPNVSKDWLIQGYGPMLTSEPTAPTTPLPTASVAVFPAETISTTVSAVAPVASESAPEPVAATQAPVVAAVSQQASAPVVIASVETSAAPVSVAAPVAASMPPAPVVAPATAPEAAWQTALYTQQMAHQLAMAELRNQHLQDQQRLMQQMLDLMQRRM
jgi:hypothetical protein